MEAREYAATYALEDDHWWFRAKRALVFSLLRRHGALAGPGLDVGCGTGATLQALAGRGRWVGVDRAALALAFCRRRGLRHLAQASALALPFRAASFAVCLCLDVLYHRGVASDVAALTEIHRVLRPGGLLVVTDSALAWLRSAHDEAMHGARRYARGELLARVRAAGFTPLEASYHYGLVFPAVAGVRLARRLARQRAGVGSDLRPVPRPLTVLLLGVQALERALLRLAPLPVGSSVYCVARKP